MDRYTYARRWLHETAGHAEATRRITQEARLLRVDPLSNAAIIHAIAAYQAETGKTPRKNPLPGDTPDLQEGLI